MDTYQISLNFEQILELVQQLPPAEKLRLSKELEKETRGLAKSEALRGLLSAGAERSGEAWLRSRSQIN